MASSTLADFRGNMSALPPGRVELLRARVVAAPESSAALVRVQAVNDSSGGVLYLGDASWPKLGEALPAAGQECLVAIDDENRPWVIAWATPSWG